MSHARGSIMPRRRVPCRGGCGKRLLRASHFATARCVKCLRRQSSRGYALRVKDLRSQARRYRIITHVLGWPNTAEGFSEMLAEMRRAPMAFRFYPETRAAKIDLRNERRKSA